MKKTLFVLIASLVLAGFALSACSGGSSASIVGEWKLVSYGSPSNSTSAVPGVDTSISFGSDGRLNGNVGCNSFGGDYKVADGKITFGSMMTTLMACEDTVGKQESAVLAVFANTASFSLKGDTLTITSADGSSVVTLAKE